MRNIINDNLAGVDSPNGVLKKTDKEYLECLNFGSQKLKDLLTSDETRSTRDLKLRSRQVDKTKT